MSKQKREPEKQSNCSQVEYPWRATFRSVVTATIALLPILPEIAREAGIAEIPAVAKVLAVTIVVQRVLTLRPVEDWINRYIPWLSATGYTGKHRKDSEDITDED